MYAKSYDIVGYSFKADIFCPNCIGLVVASQEEFEGWELARGIRMAAEDNLNEIAAAFEINREDESSFDSDEFPKVMHRDSLDGNAVNVCGECFAMIGE